MGTQELQNSRTQEKLPATSGQLSARWIPAFAGMTAVYVQTTAADQREVGIVGLIEDKNAAEAGFKATDFR